MISSKSFTVMLRLFERSRESEQDVQSSASLLAETHFLGERLFCSEKRTYVMSKCQPLEYAIANITDYVLSTFGERCQSISIVAPTIVIYSLILVIGVFGNICTCIVIVANKSMHNLTNFYLFSLAVSDILALILGLPMELYGVLDYAYPYQFGNSICKLRAFLIEFTSYASILIICSFSLERWLAICHPLRVKHFSTISRAYILIVASWCISFVAALPMAFIVKINKLPLPEFAIGQDWTSLVSEDGVTIDHTGYCAMDASDVPGQKKLIYFAFFAFFLVPAFLITIMYCHIAANLKRADRYLTCSVKGESPGNPTRKSTRTVLKMLISVVVTFFLCWLPFHVQRLLSFTMEQGEASPAVQFIFTLVFYISGYCYYSNSAVNPILYNILSQKYRTAFCRTILGERLTRKLFPRWNERKAGTLVRSNLEPSSHKGSFTKTALPQEHWQLVKNTSQPSLKISPVYM